MKKVTIVGLGLIGASYAIGLTKAGYQVFGVDTSSESIAYALENKYIVAGSKELDTFLKQSEIIIFAVYPQTLLSLLNKYDFQENQIVTDVCGIKESFIAEATNLVKPASYCSHHPMAGKEKIGIKYADPLIFRGANFLITPTLETPKYAIEVLEKLGTDLKFSNIKVITPAYHDQMIGFTSTLTHAIAVALVNSDKNPDTVAFIGDSYRDLTRIAMINENLWLELFLENKVNLLQHLENFETEIEKIKKALVTNDREQLKMLFNQSTTKRKTMEKSKN